MIVMWMSIHVHAQILERCTAELRQCEEDLRTPSLTNRSRLSCQACHFTCNSLTEGEGKSKDEAVVKLAGYQGWSCLDKCAKRNCVGNDNDDANVREDFRCKVHGHRCWHQHKNRARNASAIREFCGKCVSTCRNIMRDSSEWCEARCEEYNTTCAAHSNASMNSPVSTPAVSSREPARKTTPRPNSVSDSTSKQTNRTPRADGSPKLWDWLGPVLGSAATIIGAVITVVWVRGHRQQSLGTMKSTSTDGPATGEYDEDWLKPNKPVGVSYGTEQSTIRPNRFPWFFRTTDSVSKGTTRNSTL